MASTYMTSQGDTWDLMAYNLYGAEKYMRYLAEANWPLLDILVFPSGIKINVPDIQEDAAEDVPFWRADDTGDDQPTEEKLYEQST